MMLESKLLGGKDQRDWQERKVVEEVEEILGP